MCERCVCEGEVGVEKDCANMLRAVTSGWEDIYVIVTLFFVLSCEHNITLVLKINATK